MDFLTELWLPILLSAVAVFFTSSLIHMVLKYHMSDYDQLPNEDEALGGMRGKSIPPGDYVFPYCMDYKDMQTDEMQARYNDGPVGFMTLMPNGPWTMGKQLLQWFLFCVMAGVFIAYATSLAIQPGDDFMRVLRVAGTIAFLAYAGSQPTNSIWKAQKWSSTMRFLLDGILYGLATGAIFAWLWPSL